MSSTAHIFDEPPELPDFSNLLNLGFASVAVNNGQLEAVLPANVIALRPMAGAGPEPLTNLLKGFGVPPSLTFRHSDGLCSLFRVDDATAADRLEAALPEGVGIIRSGEPLRLSAVHGDLRVTHLDQLAVLRIPDRSPPVAAERNFLRQFSLQGKAADLEALAQQTTPLLGEICLSGQSTIWYAPPNAGKTLCALRLTHDAITERRIAAGDVYYFNADDSSSGLAQKLRILDDLGAHTIAPGFNGFRNADLLEHLKQTAARKEARGTLVLVDTVKKFTSLMDKRQSSEFADACRQYVMQGGTILGLAHTAKNPNPNGELRYGGTTDLLEDFDAAYLLTPLKSAGEVGERIVEFRSLKRRGDNAEIAAYRYASGNGISYEERLLSVEAVDPSCVDEFKRVADERDDATTIAAITALIGEGVNQKMLLGKAAAKRSGVSERNSIRVLERYTGNPPEGLWSFVVKARGAKVYELVPPAPA